MLTVSIVTYRTAPEELEACLGCLTDPSVNKVYVVDNSSDPAIAEVCAKSGAVYMANENKGYGAGHNVAMRLALDAGTDYHLVMNSDVSFNPDVPARLIDFMDKRPDIGEVQPRIVSPDGAMQHTARMLPTPLDLLIRRFLPRWMMRRRRIRYLLKHLDHSVPLNVPYHQGSFLFIRAKALREVGLFDERFFLYPEDIDLCRRIHARYLTVSLPEPAVVHSHRRESYSSWRMTCIHMVNMARYFNKWGWFFDPERRRVNRYLRR